MTRPYLNHYGRPAARPYGGKLSDYMRQLRQALDGEAELDALEANAWRMFGLAVEDVQDERIITNPNRRT